jgi:hypothetical protein
VTHAWIVACWAAVRQAGLPASVVGFPVHPAPLGICPFLIRMSVQAPTVVAPLQAVTVPFGAFCVSE